MSLSAPLSGHGVTGTDRFALTCMCLAVGTVLIRVLALTIRPSRQPADDAAAGGQAAVAGAGRAQLRPWRAPSALTLCSAAEHPGRDSTVTG